MKPFRILVVNPGSTSTGQVDGIVVTGGLARDARLAKWTTGRVSIIARVFGHPGEDEMEALRDGPLRVLTGEEGIARVGG